MTDQPTEKQMKAAKEQVKPPPVPTGMGDVPPGAVPYETDVSALVAQMEAMQARLDAMEADRRSQQLPELVSTVAAARDLIGAHVNTSGLSVPADMTRLADDLVAAATEAAESGDVSQVQEIDAKLAKVVHRAHPGPGDYHWYRQLIDYVDDHIPEAADRVTAPAA